MIKILPLVVLTATCFAGTGELEVRVRPTAAGPQIHVDGKPVPPRFFFYWAGSRASETNAATLRTVAAAGVDLIEVGIAHSFLSPKRERVRWTAFEGPDDWSIADDQVRKAIEAHPNGKFLLRIFVNAPKAVLESNPDWCMKFEDDDDVKGERMASPSCRQYREAVCAYLKRAVKHFSETFPNHYAGIHPSGQNSGEFFYDKAWTKLSGYDKHTLAAWRKWLAERGESDAATAEVPTPAERKAKDDGSVLLDPVKRRRVIQFNQFLQDEMSDFVAEMARACREASGDKKLVVFFYGYAWEFNSLPNGPAVSGHYGLMRLIEKAPGAIDILCGPIGYFNRRYPDGFAPVMSAAETLARHGILWLNEDDTRTCRDPRRDRLYTQEGTLTTCENNCKVMLRNTAKEAIRGLGSWWMDLYGHGWYDDPALWEVQRRLWPSERALLARPRPYTPDVAAIVGEQSQLHFSAESRAVTRPLIYTVRGEFDKAGVRYGQYLLEDVLKNPPPAKVHVFLSANYLTAADRAALAKDRVEHPERVRVWCFAPGYLSDRGADEKGITEVTGFSVKRIDKSGDKIRPFFSPDAEGGEVWARFPDGSPSVAARSAGAGMDVFCATPELTADVIRRAAKAAGVHLYLKSGNAGVYADAGFVSVQALEDGEVAVDFGETGDIVDAMTGEKVGEGPVYSVSLKAGDARLFRVISAKGGALPPLPVARAPFEQTEDFARRPVSLVSYPFMSQFYVKDRENLFTWAEFIGGNKVAVVNGCDLRVRGAGRTGFGRIALYNCGSDTTALAWRNNDPYMRGLDCWLSVDFIDGKPDPQARYRDSFPDAVLTVDDVARRTEWKRKCKLPDGTEGEVGYSVSAIGDGLLAVDFNGGGLPVEVKVFKPIWVNGITFDVAGETRLQVNRAREEARFEIVFPDGKVEATSGSERAKATEAIQVPHYVWRSNAASGRVIIDLCGSTTPNSSTLNSSTPTSGIIDFWAEDAVDVPRDPTGNFVPNGSFEQGLAYWSYNWGGTSWDDVAATGGPLEYVTDEAKVGDKALCMRASKTRGAYEHLRSAGMSIEPGVPHVLSAWVKRAAGEEGAAKITIQAQSTHKLGRVTSPQGDAATKSVTLTDNEWRFVEVPFTSVLGDCMVFLSGSGAAALVDGVRVEREEVNGVSRVERVEHVEEMLETANGRAGSPCPPQCVEGRLETASAENIVCAGAPINARLVLSGPDGVEGSVRVTVRNFYNETVYDNTLKFTLPKDKVLPLDFDPACLGTGVFVLGTEFDVKNNLNNYRSPYQRFAILKPLDGTHETANFYVQFPYYERGSNGEKLARYAKAIGITTTTWERNSAFADTNAPTARLRRKYGITARLHCVSSELAQKYPDRFGPGKEGLKAFTNAVPEQIAFIEKEAYLAGLGAAPDDNWWALWNEEDGQLPTLRNAKSSEARYAACESWFEYQYACWKGLKKAFDERGLKLMYAPTHGSCNYINTERREMIDFFMEVAAKRGFHYDFIAVHTYWGLDKSFMGYSDRDEDAALLLSRMAHYGYPETTPVMFSEGFNFLPFTIQRWYAEGSADNYNNGVGVSLDLGWREFLQVGSMARLYVMDLKYWPRAMTSHTWQSRLVADAQMSPYMWNMVPNTMGHILPSPKFVGDVKRDGWRAYVFRQGDYGVAAVWTNERQAELGRKKGRMLKLALPKDVRFVDLMGNDRATPPADADGIIAVPLTPAPLFVVAHDAEGLLKVFEEAR